MKKIQGIKFEVTKNPTSKKELVIEIIKTDEATSVPEVRVVGFREGRPPKRTLRLK